MYLSLLACVTQCDIVDCKCSTVLLFMVLMSSLISLMKHRGNTKPYFLFHLIRFELIIFSFPNTHKLGRVRTYKIYKCAFPAVFCSSILLSRGIGLTNLASYFRHGLFRHSNIASHMSAVVIRVPNILILTFLDVTHIPRCFDKKKVFTILLVVLNFDSEYLSCRVFNYE